MNLKNSPFFENSVRCFFPLAAASAVIGPAYLVCVLVNQYPFSHPFFNIFEWHAFEMLFGFLMTLIAGFILTAGGHWTGKGPLSGNALVAFFFLWFVDKIFLFVPMPNIFYFLTAAIFPVAFIFLLSNLLKGYRQYWRFMAIVTFLGISKLLYLYAALYGNFQVKEFAMKTTIWVVSLLIAIIGGRIIPRFTKNFFKLDYDLTVPRPLELASFISLGTVFIWTLSLETRWPAGLALICAGLINASRVGFYMPLQAIKRPIIGTLHVGYFLLSLGLVYMGLAEFLPSFDVGRASLHLLVTGGFSLIAINVMVRASLGHTGRKIELTPAVAAMFLCVLIGTLLRTFVPPFAPELYYPSLHISMGFWTLGFLIYLLKFIPIMLKKRADA